MSSLFLKQFTESAKTTKLDKQVNLINFGNIFDFDCNREIVLHNGLDVEVYDLRPSDLRHYIVTTTNLLLYDQDSGHGV